MLISSGVQILKIQTPVNDFYYEKFVQFHETDIMGIAHHANHLKWMEESRMAWLKKMDVEKYHSPKVDYTLAVLESFVSYKKPCPLGELVRVYLKIYLDKSKFRFYYGMYIQDQLCATGHTLHIGVDKNMKVIKPPVGITEYTEKGQWTETWPSNL